MAKIGLYFTTKPLNTLTIDLTILSSVRKKIFFLEVEDWRYFGKNRPVIYFDYTFDYTVINKTKILFLEVEDWCYFVAKISLNFTTKPSNTLIIQLTILPSIWDKNFLYISSLIFTVHPFKHIDYTELYHVGDLIDNHMTMMSQLFNIKFKPSCAFSRKCFMLRKLWVLIFG